MSTSHWYQFGGGSQGFEGRCRRMCQHKLSLNYLKEEKALRKCVAEMIAFGKICYNLRDWNLGTW